MSEQPTRGMSGHPAPSTDGHPKPSNEHPAPPNELPAPSSEFALAFVTEFVRQGGRHAVVCPGSRSQALALVCAALEEAGDLSVHVRIDERSAGFLALGLAVETGMPTLVVVTSGTAVANLHPAVLEAWHSGVPLLVASADRPVELRGIGANQATRQPHIFGSATVWECDAEAPTPTESDLRGRAEALARAAFHAAVDAPGPAHANLAFREPLSSPILLPLAAAAYETGAAYTNPTPSTPHPIHASPRTVVIAGHGAGPAAEETAHLLGAPLLAEVTSGARYGRNLVVAYRELLDLPDFGGAIERVVVFGHPTLSRQVPALISRLGASTTVVRSAAAEDYNPAHAVHLFVDAVTVVGPPDPDRSWVGRWVQASRQLVDAADDTPRIDAPDAVDGQVTGEFQRQTLAALRAPVSRASLARQVWAATWPHDRLVVGASRLIREMDRTVPGKKVRAHANRGLAGIDGTISTAAGIALAAPAGGTTRVLMGDLTFLHDVGGLLAGAGEATPPVQIVVGNDGGGTIFDGLEVALSTPQKVFDRVQYTPQRVNLEALAEAYGWQYVRASTRSELDQALTGSVGRVIIEVPLPRG